MSMHRTIRNAGLLMAVNLAGMALPLLALPILAHRLGVDAFGMVVLAQGIGMLPVLLVDAGFNAESMRVTGCAREAAPLQPLLDNLIARTRLGTLAATGTLLIGMAIPGLPLAFVAVALLQLAGTLLFPQWWLIATGATPQLLVLQLSGRILSMLGVLWLVRTPDDALLATALQCGATLLSGAGFVATHLLPRLPELSALDRSGHRTLASRAMPAAGSGFAVALSTQTPQLFLGAVAGMQQVGLFACGDKIARAAAFAFGAIDQSFLAPVAGRSRDDDDASRRIARRVTLSTLAIALFTGVMLAVTAHRVVPWLFGDAFAAAGAVLALFGAWLPLHATRRAFLNLHFAARGRQDLIARCQYVEAVTTVACCSLGASFGGALGAATGLLLSEAIAWATALALQHRNRNEA